MPSYGTCTATNNELESARISPKGYSLLMEVKQAKIPLRRRILRGTTAVRDRVAIIGPCK